MKIDKVALCEKFNTLRCNNLHKTFSSNEMWNLMHSIGINKHIFSAMSKEGEIFFRKRRNGQVVQYCFTDVPVYKGTFIKLYNSYNKTLKTPPSQSDEEKAINLLKSLGYKIFKDEGIDETALQNQYPEIYEKFLIINEI